MFYVVGVLGIAALILIHEAGHFLVARAFGMRVKRFSLGFFKPIVEWKPEGSETTYAIGSLPLGGYVQVDGLSPADEVDPEDRRSYANQPAHAKLLMVLAGPASNFLAAVVLFAVLFMAGVEVPTSEPRLGAVSPGEPAARAGLEPGDLVLAIDGEEVSSWDQMAAHIHGNPGRPIVLRLRRGERELELEATPADSSGLGLIGVRPSTRMERRGPVAAVGSGFVMAGAISAGLVVLLVRMASCRASTAGVAGPLGILDLSAEMLRSGYRDYLMFLGQISVSLFLFNFLPLPALDGGRMTFLAVELVSRRRPNPTVEGYIHAFGLVVLLGLLLLITLRDCHRWFGS